MGALPPQPTPPPLSPHPQVRDLVTGETFMHRAGDLERVTQYEVGGTGGGLIHLSYTSTQAQAVRREGLCG